MPARLLATIRGRFGRHTTSPIGGILMGQRLERLHDTSLHPNDRRRHPFESGRMPSSVDPAEEVEVLEPHRGIRLERNGGKQLRHLFEREPRRDFEQIALQIEIPLTTNLDPHAELHVIDRRDIGTHFPEKSPLDHPERVAPYFDGNLSHVANMLLMPACIEHRLFLEEEVFAVAGQDEEITVEANVMQVCETGPLSPVPC